MILAGLLLLVLAVGILYVVLVPKDASPEVSQQPGGQNPFLGIGSGTIASGERSLALSDGTTVSVPDFSAVPQPDWVSQQEYQVAGSPMDSYLITYIEPDQDSPQGEFLVTLLAEPLGETREAAAQALLERLQISRSDLCKLDANVVAGPGVNDLYPPDYDLEFASCEGAVELP